MYSKVRRDPWKEKRALEGNAFPFTRHHFSGTLIHQRTTRFPQYRHENLCLWCLMLLTESSHCLQVHSCHTVNGEHRGADYLPSELPHHSLLSAVASPLRLDLRRTLFPGTRSGGGTELL